MATYELIPEPTVVLPYSAHTDVEELFPVEVPEVGCIPWTPDGGLVQRTDTIVEKLIEINYPDEIEPLASDSLILTPEKD